MKTNINIFNALNESLEEEFKAKRKVKSLTEAERIDPNNLTKEQLWKLRQEIVLGSIYINDYKNSFKINPESVCSFFDSFIEDAQQDDDGNFNNRKTEDFDNAEELYNYYLSCENPFGDLTEADKVEVDKDGNKSIRDTKTGHLKKITVSKKTQDKMADEHNKKLDESSEDRYEVWQRYYDDEFNRNGEYVQSFDNYEQAAKFVAGLMRDSNCEAWIVDKFEESSLNETGEWDDNDEEMSAWLEDLRGQAQELADEISGEVKSVTGFDAYQGPRAVVNSPKHGDVIMWFDPEDDTGRSFNVKVAHVGWISGGIKQLADLLNQDTIPENEIISESEDTEFYKNKYKNTFDRWKKSNPQASDKEIVDIIKAKQYNGELHEEDVIQINDTNIEPDYLIQDVTILDQVGDGDVQSPDIEAMLTLVDSALKENYSKEWGHIKTLSSKIDENTSYALVDISTPEILKEFESRGIKDAAIGKNLILEKVNDKLVEFKVNNLNGTTKYSKKTSNPQQAIYEWIETEFLQEAKEEKAKEAEVAKAKTEKETVENYINNRLDLKMEIENIKMFIELSKNVKAEEEMKPAIQERMYAFAAEVPHQVEVKSKDDKYELSFSNLDQVVEMVFGKEWIKEKEDVPEVVSPIKESDEYFGYTIEDDKEEYGGPVKKDRFVQRAINNGFDYDNNKEDKAKVDNYYKEYKAKFKKINEQESQKINESYEQFNIGEIEVVFNPDTYETLYSIPSADVQDKKINLTKVPTVDTPYDTDTIIKSYIETKFGRIPTEEEQKVEDNGETLEPNPETSEVPQEEEIPQDNINIDEPDLTEDELPDEPEENETPAEVEEEVPKAETGSATFMKIRPKQPVSIEDLRQQIIDGNTPTSSYIVVDNIDLSAEEFNDLSNNLNEQRSWLEGIQSIDRKNYSFNVIKVTSSGSSYSLLIDPLGYNYPRYVSVVDEASI